MSTFQSQIDCPNCKSEAFEIFNYKTGEEYMSCTHCGYLKQFHYERDELGKFILLDSSKPVDFDNFKINEINIEKPFGAYSIKSIDNCSQNGSFEKIKEYEDFKLSIEGMVSNPNNVITEITFSRFINGEIKIEELYSNQNN